MTEPLELRFPVSYAQQRLWLLDRLSPGSILYVIPLTLRLTTAIDAGALARSLNEIVQRHEVLRTTFELQDGALVQVVGSSLILDLPVVDLQHCDPDDRETAVRERAAEEARRPFDLTTGPLLRAKLFRLAPCDHLLFVAIHHIVADGWSLGIFLSELRAIYPEFVHGRPSPLPELPIQYVDYAAWQRQRLEHGVLDEELSYWREELAGLPVFSLPMDRGAAAPPRRHAMTLAPSTAARLAALGRQEGATLFMTLLAGFQVLLHRYSGCGDFAVGTVIASRTRAETEVLIGCFVNTLVIRSRVQGSETFRALLRKTRETTLSAYAHQELPFERLVEELRPARDAGRNPLVQILFSFQNTPAVSQHPVGEVRAGWELDRGSANFDLTVDLWDTPEGLESRWEYRAEAFDADAVEGLMRHYRNLLEALAADPDLPVSRLPLLDPSERRALLALGCGPSVEFPAMPVHRCIAQRAAERADRVAVRSEAETVTYGQLQARVDRLALELLRRGVSRNELVGICLPRSPSFGVGLLGVLGAGSAFLAMDPGDPQLRRARLLQDAHVRMVVTNSASASGLDFGSADVVCLDTLAGPDAMAGERLEGIFAGDLAYMVYTSGSTGVPKGTLVPHGALANHCHAVAARYELRQDDRCLQLAPVGFDVVLEELLPIWLTGGAVVFPDGDGALAFPDLERAVGRYQITLLNLPASYWHEWVDHLSRTNSRPPDSLRLVVCGSERVSTEKLRLWQELAGSDVRWMNAYGVTEATITATTCEPARPLETDFPDIVPIGRPLANVQAWVLDEAGEPSPAGVAGELHLGGAGVALGYLGSPELTRTQFRQSPFSTAPDALLYRTGDLVRFRRDGNLEFLGRSDSQLKIRGYRVDPGEIEAALMLHPDVSEAVVQPPRDGNGRMVAYVVPGGSPSLDPSALAAFLQARLPGHMVPGAFVVLPALPRSPRGKIDRTALAIETGAAALPMRVPPRNTLELQLADLWAELLNRPDVGISDNFFELGGHSLLAMRLLSRVQATLGVEISLRTLFEAPTIAGLTAAIGESRPPSAPDAIFPERDGLRVARDLLPLEVDRLSDIEVDALLAELLAEGDSR